MRVGGGGANSIKTVRNNNNKGGNGTFNHTQSLLSLEGPGGEGLNQDRDRNLESCLASFSFKEMVRREPDTAALEHLNGGDSKGQGSILKKL